MTTLTLAYPWLLALVPLPFLVRWLVPAHRAPRQGLVVPFLQRLADASGQRPGPGVSPSRAGVWRTLVLSFCWLAAVLALARPQVIEPPVTKEIPVRDLLLAVDLSGSMETRDFTDAQGRTTDRLTSVKTVLDDFLERRQGDRVGLLFFGSAAFVQAPFTEDLDVCRELLNEAQVRMAGPQTAFGDALGLAISVFDRSTTNQRVLIALTDGNDTASQVPPAKAAQIAKDRGIVIHTVAVGDPESAGEDALDEATLEQVAATTGGLYSHAADRTELEAVYDRLDALETREVETVSHRPRRDVYWWPLAAALAASGLYVLALLVTHTLRTGTAGRRAPPGAPSAALASAAPLGVGAAASAFHFLRPGWLLALLPVALLWWLLRRRTASDRAWRGVIAPSLLPYLLGGEPHRRRFGPLAWLGLAWLVTVVAIAGPAWRQEPAAFADETAAIAIVMNVSPSLQTADVPPSRAERAVMKIHDLLAARGNAKTALVAYAGTAHVVMPATSDAGIVETFAGALDPDVMPEDGDAAAAALALADQVLGDAGGGSILWITDGVAPEQAAALAAWRESSATAVRLWPPLAAGAELDALIDAAAPADPDVVRLAADDSDVRAVASAARFAPRRGDAADARWAESGYWLTPLIALLVLAFFRRGWQLPAAGARA